MDLVCKDEGARDRKFTLWDGFKEVAFDSADDVLQFVGQHPDGSYTIYLGKGVGLDCDEVREIRQNWRK